MTLPNALTAARALLVIPVIGLIAIPLCFVFIGIPILIGLGVWFVYRTLKGLIRALEGRAYS